jgi:hypothetical protein
VTTPSVTRLQQLHGGRAMHIARMTISQFVVDQADKTSAEVGFGYEPRAGAPSTFPVLKAAFDHSAATGEPLPVSNEHSESVVYADAEVNFAMRFWHDVNHVRRGLTFDLVDELELALWHLNVLEGEGFGSETVVWQLLHTDLVGAIYVMSLSRRFPLDQLRFAEGCVATGFDAGVLTELRWKE